ncbi:MAG TPA: 50S ribosomal protein L30 [Candidatus Binataceae bacterium]|nr:50S ribosomal protein L30 [Candidatus Binataceae bacterium]
MAEVIRIKLVRSPIGTTQRVRETLRGLGLNKLGRERELVRTPAVEGMLRRVSHLVAELKSQGHAG